MLKQGPWGEYVVKCQSKLEPPQNMMFASETQKVIWQQKRMRSTTNDWKLLGSRQFPLLNDVANRLSFYVNQSANVERVCKAHKAVHSVTQNRLTNKNVHILLYLYVNLRLFNQCDEEWSTLR